MGRCGTRRQRAFQADLNPLLPRAPHPPAAWPRAYAVPSAGVSATRSPSDLLCAQPSWNCGAAVTAAEATCLRELALWAAGAGAQQHPSKPGASGGLACPSSQGQTKTSTHSITQALGLPDQCAQLLGQVCEGFDHDFDPKRTVW
jgi:hypothetical protein